MNRRPERAPELGQQAMVRALRSSKRPRMFVRLGSVVLAPAGLLLGWLANRRADRDGVCPWCGGGTWSDGRFGKFCEKCGHVQSK